MLQEQGTVDYDSGAIAQAEPAAESAEAAPTDPSGNVVIAAVTEDEARAPDDNRPLPGARAGQGEEEEAEVDEPQDDITGESLDATGPVIARIDEPSEDLEATGPVIAQNETGLRRQSAEREQPGERRERDRGRRDRVDDDEARDGNLELLAQMDTDRSEDNNRGAARETPEGPVPSSSGSTRAEPGQDPGNPLADDGDDGAGASLGRSNVGSLATGGRDRDGSTGSGGETDSAGQQGEYADAFVPTPTPASDPTPVVEETPPAEPGYTIGEAQRQEATPVVVTGDVPSFVEGNDEVEVATEETERYWSQQDRERGESTRSPTVAVAPADQPPVPTPTTPANRYDEGLVAGLEDLVVDDAEPARSSSSSRAVADSSVDNGERADVEVSTTVVAATDERSLWAELCEQGSTEFSLGNFAPAIDFLQRCLANAPAGHQLRHTATWNLAQSQYYAGDYHSSLGNFNQIIDLGATAPYYYEANNLLLQAYDAVGDDDNALRAYRRLLDFGGPLAEDTEEAYNRVQSRRARRERAGSDDLLMMESDDDPAEAAEPVNMESFEAEKPRTVSY
jgi:hypothetical protein